MNRAIPRNPRPLFKAGVLFLIAFALYFFTRSPALDEIDPIQFAMGVRSFDLWHHQPHPPGYPLFIFLGWLGGQLFGAGPALSLYFVSAAGGGLFIGVWFLIIREQFSERLAWWVAGCLMIMPIVWMTATKALTDAPAAALLSAEILATIYYSRGKSISSLATAALLGAAATGIRPQLVLIAAIILGGALKKNPAKMWWIGFGLFIAGCLLWLVPMSYMQARLHAGTSIWRVYLDLVYGQWCWRLDNPGAYLGAGDWTPAYLGSRFANHILRWFAWGFAFQVSVWAMIVGIALTLAGFVAYFALSLQRVDRDFWRYHRTWALVHIVIIFCSLPGHQRYYLMIYPLLLVMFLRGLLAMPRPWSTSAVLLPALLFCISVPLAIQNHRDEAPSVEVVRYLEKLYPPGERKRVVLIFSKAERAAQWYAPEFQTIHELPTFPEESEILMHASAIYADDKLKLPPGWDLQPIVSFERSYFVYPGGKFVQLFQVNRPTSL